MLKNIKLMLYFFYGFEVLCYIDNKYLKILVISVLSPEHQFYLPFSLYINF
jgi:hypothetical protein